eukprot:Polyplicarium_translucidae@DN3303_c0_g3_i6.p2
MEPTTSEEELEDSAGTPNLPLTTALGKRPVNCRAEVLHRHQRLLQLSPRGGGEAAFATTPTVAYLGYEVSAEGIRADPNRMVPRSRQSPQRPSRSFARPLGR